MWSDQLFQYMRALYTGVALIIAHAASAQLLNGSFEMNGAPSLYGWEWTCADPGQPNEGAPGSGEWCATKGPGETKGCFPSYIYQRLPDVVDGQAMTLSGWIRCSDEEPCVGGYMGIGTLNNGLITTGAAIGSQLPSWEFVYINQTVDLGPGDTAVAVLNGGIIGGPIAVSPTYFDGIMLEIAMGVEPNAIAEGPLFRLSPDGQHLAVNAGADDVIRVHDALGKLLHQGTGSAAGWRTIALPRGEHVLLITVEGNGKRRSQRLVHAH